jgi:hypothetical protein
MRLRLRFLGGTVLAGVTASEARAEPTAQPPALTSIVRPSVADRSSPKEIPETTEEESRPEP